MQAFSSSQVDIAQQLNDAMVSGYFHFTFSKLDEAPPELPTFLMTSQWNHMMTLVILLNNKSKDVTMDSEQMDNFVRQLGFLEPRGCDDVKKELMQKRDRFLDVFEVRSVTVNSIKIGFHTFSYGKAS